MEKGKYAKKPAPKRSKKNTGLTVTIVLLIVLAVVLLVIFAMPQWKDGVNSETGPIPESTPSNHIAETQGQNAAATGGNGNAEVTDEGHAAETTGGNGDAEVTDESYAAETTGNNGNTEAPEENPVVPDTVVSFPISVEGGKLEITSLQIYNGINPDCGNQEGEDVAGIMLKNTSKEYLAEAAITLTLSDGTVANFLVTDLPAGRTAMAFSTENAKIASDAVCAQVSCESKFDSGASLSADAVAVSVDGVVITLTNISGTDLDNIVVYCHNILDPDYFGGITYTYKVEHLPAGESTTVEAWDCILGMAEVVRVDAE